MVNITTITNIEVSSECQLSCQYCMAKEQSKYREVGQMSLEIFKKALEWVRYFTNKGTQRELNLFGIGEPLLNEHIAEMVRLARQVVPIKYRVHLNTNGIALTTLLASKLKTAGLTDMDITGHEARPVAQAIRILKEVGIGGSLSMDFMTRPNTWAGQVNWFPSDIRYPCPWLHIGQAMVLSDGRIVQCCFDAKALNVLGHVNDTPGEIITSEFELCKHCHQDVPREI